MNRRLMTILFLAFIIAAGCAFLVYRLVANRVSASRPIQTTRIVAAASDIKLGAVISAINLTTMEIVGAAPKGAILKPENAVGRGVISDLYQGEPILESRLAPVGSGGGLAATIPAGMRACAIRVDDVVGVAGFVTPGQRVDVVITGVPPGNQPDNQGTVAKTILQNIQVLSAGTDIQKDAEGKPQTVQVVNLLVTPEQAETLSLVGSQIKIQLVLRNPLDTTVTAVAGTATGNIFGQSVIKPARVQHAAHVAPKAPAPKPFSIEIINGSKHSETNFGTPEGPQ